MPRSIKINRISRSSLENIIQYLSFSEQMVIREINHEFETLVLDVLKKKLKDSNRFGPSEVYIDEHIFKRVEDRTLRRMIHFANASNSSYDKLLKYAFITALGQALMSYGYFTYPLESFSLKYPIYLFSGLSALSPNVFKNNILSFSSKCSLVWGLQYVGGNNHFIDKLFQSYVFNEMAGHNITAILAVIINERDNKVVATLKKETTQTQQTRYYELGKRSASNRCSLFLSYFKVCGKKANKEWYAGYAKGLQDESAKKIQKEKLRAL